MRCLRIIILFVLLIAMSSYEILVAIIQDKPVILNIKRCMVMSKRLTAFVFVKSTERKCVSNHGNPSYWVTFVQKDSSKLKGYTASNSQCGYSASNFIDKLAKIEYHFSTTGNIIIDTMKEVWGFEGLKINTC